MHENSQIRFVSPGRVEQQLRGYVLGDMIEGRKIKETTLHVFDFIFDWRFLIFFKPWVF